MKTDHHSKNPTAKSHRNSGELTSGDRRHVRDYAEGLGGKSKREQIACLIGSSIEARDLFFESLLASS